MPRNPDRIPVVLDVIAKAWEAHSDLRLGQLLDNAIHKLTNTDLFSIEDDKLVAAIEESFKQSSGTEVPMVIPGGSKKFTLF